MLIGKTQGFAEFFFDVDSKTAQYLLFASTVSVLFASTVDVMAVTFFFLLNWMCINRLGVKSEVSTPANSLKTKILFFLTQADFSMMKKSTA